MKKAWIRLACVLWPLFVASSIFAEVGQPKPMPNTFVHDFAGVISADKKAEIQAKAQRLKNQFKTEIAVVTIDSLQGEDSFNYSMRMARSWGIGSKDNEIRGLLVLLAIKERKIAFRTSRHIEGELPDGVTGDISRSMAGYFKKGDYGGGLSSGMDAIISRLTQKPTPVSAPMTPPPETGSSSIPWLFSLLGIVLIGAAIASLLRYSQEKAGDGFTSSHPSKRNSLRGNDVPRRKRMMPAESAQQTSNFWPPSDNSDKPSYDPPSSSDSGWFGSGSASSFDSGSSSSDSGSSSSDSGSSSNSDFGSSYSGGSDFGGGGSDSSW